MFTFINRLQQKPERQRRVIAWWVALCITMGIFLLWLVSFFSRLDTNNTAAGAEENDVSPVKSLAEMVSSFAPFFEDIFNK